MEPINTITSLPNKKFVDRISSQNNMDTFCSPNLLRKCWADKIAMPLSNEEKIALIPEAVEFALSELPEHFHSALLVLHHLIPNSQILPRPLGFGEKLLTLRERVKKFSFQPNLTFTWETLITNARCLKPVERDRSYEIPASKLYVSIHAFLEYFPFPLPSVAGEESTCPVSLERIIEEGNKTCFAGVSCIFELSASIDAARWWIYRCCPNAPNFIWIGYVYIRQDLVKEVEVGHWSSHCHPMDKFGLQVELLEREFSTRHKDIQG